MLSYTQFWTNDNSYIKINHLFIRIIMYDFIKNIPLATAICTFDGEFVSVNKALLDGCKSTYESQIFNYSTFEMMVDNANQNAFVDLLLSGHKVENQKILLKKFDNTIDLYTTNVHIFSKEKKLMIFQNQLINSNHNLSSEKLDLLLKESAGFNPLIDKKSIYEMKHVSDNSLQTLKNQKLKINTPQISEPGNSSLAIKTALDMIQGKWTFSIILILMNEDTLRFNELMKVFDGMISARILSNELKRLELNGLISRRVYPTVPPTVEYRLTDKGKALNSVSDALRDWSQNFTFDINK
jgi:DNA-binding HxlR family transcriptional regulator